MTIARSFRPLGTMFAVISIMSVSATVNLSSATTPLRGSILDAATGRAIPARVYVQSSDGRWYFAKSAAPQGSAVVYDKQRGGQSIEKHVTLSAHPFVVELPPGRYTITVERGKEYTPATQTVEVGAQPVAVTIRLRRWIDMAARGWYSGDTHVHRALDELPNVMPAEDLNVAFPLTYWVAQAYASPRTARQSVPTEAPAGLVKIDDTHVFWPRNTEYEITRLENRQFVLGGFFVLNHQSVFDLGGPPVKPIAELARREGALIELDKHNWPWAMMLVPVMPADLYELSNNHVWRTEFGFPDFGDLAPEFMRIERAQPSSTSPLPKGEGNGVRPSFSERGWLEFGFQNYYTLLNCGFRLRPTAGTATGVHPVPLGFGRVYVKLRKFDYHEWVRGLNAGRSFVTTGPMLFAQVNGREAGHVFRSEVGLEARPTLRVTGSAVSDEVGLEARPTLRVTGSAVSEHPLKSIELVVNGEVVRTLKPANRATKTGAYESRFDERVQVETSSWLIVRCFEDRPDRRPRFAHTAPWHMELRDRPLRPRRDEVNFLIQRMESKLAATATVWPEPVRDEYRQALRHYQSLLSTAR